jgi:type IV pilus assembly protein PilB
MSDQLREMVMNNAAVDELRDAASAKGMVTLRRCGMNYAFEGTTTLDEVVRETILEA